ASGIVRTRPAGTPADMRSSSHSLAVRLANTAESSARNAGELVRRSSGVAKRGSDKRSSLETAEHKSRNCLSWLAANASSPSFVANTPDDGLSLAGVFPAGLGITPAFW